MRDFGIFAFYCQRKFRNFTEQKKACLLSVQRRQTETRSHRNDVIHDVVAKTPDRGPRDVRMGTCVTLAGSMFVLLLFVF